MADINNVILLVNDVKHKAVARNQLATANVLNNVASELKSLNQIAMKLKDI